MELLIHDIDSDLCQAAFQGEMTIYGVVALKAQIERLLAEHRAVEIDLSGITDIDSAGLQLMLAAKRRAGQALHFTRHSQPVLQLLELSNLARVLGAPQAPPLPGKHPS